MVSDPMEAVLVEVRRRLAGGREGNFIAELGGENLGFVLYWGRLRSDAASTPPDERYLVDEVRPTGLDVEGRIQWEAVPDGRQGETAWNVAESLERTHKLEADLVVLVREDLDCGDPSEFRSLFYSPPPGGAGGSRMCRIESFNSTSGHYTVQPVVWDGVAWAASGSAISGVPNVGELHAVERGYLAGPTSETIYARLYEEEGEQFLAVHPPRLL